MSQPGLHQQSGKIQCSLHESKGPDVHLVFLLLLVIVNRDTGVQNLLKSLLLKGNMQ